MISMWWEDGSEGPNDYEKDGPTDLIGYVISGYFHKKQVTESSDKNIIHLVNFITLNYGWRWILDRFA